MVKNTYNDLNELINKKTGNNLQSIDYTYNIRGWMTSMNNPDNLGTDLFGYKIKYENPVYTNIALGKYNGNISEVDWATSKDGVLKRYSYQYDALNRLKLGNYSEPNASIPQNNYFNESMSYDVNGNIMTLKRNRKLENVGVQLMDDLAYVYSGNRLHTVTDASSNYSGYPDVSGNLIHYDINGNMTDHLDKGLMEIKYNYLHLPTYIKFDQFVIREDLFGQGLSTKYKNTSYLYRADGVKLKKIHNYFSGRMQVDAATTTEYFDGFQYSGESDEYSLKNVSLQFLPTSEGYYDFAKNKYIYQYKDQIGNIRLAYYRDNNNNVAIDRATDYYPFGLEFGGSLNTYGSLSPNYAYGFQEQEKQQDTGWDSFKWRNYDPTIGRFFNVDPLSEKYAYQSHYNFSENWVTSHRELEGLEAIDAKKIREVFNNGKQGKSYQLVIHIDQPGKGGDRNTYEYNKGPDPGHAFITLNRKNTDGTTDSKTFGFYPYPQSVNPLASEADGKVRDNFGHEQEVVQTRPITEKNFNNILDFVESEKNTKYDLNTNNCTDFVINAAAAANIKLPRTKGTWPNGGGSNPGDFGEDLREQNKNIRKGKSPEGTSRNENKNKEDDKKISL